MSLSVKECVEGVLGQHLVTLLGSGVRRLHGSGAREPRRPVVAKHGRLAAERLPRGAGEDGIARALSVDVAAAGMRSRDGGRGLAGASRLMSFFLRCETSWRLMRPGNAPGTACKTRAAAAVCDIISIWRKICFDRASTLGSRWRWLAALGKPLYSGTYLTLGGRPAGRPIIAALNPPSAVDLKAFRSKAFFIGAGQGL